MSYFLNDNYIGGEIEFARFNLKIKPKANQALFFPSNYVYNHQVHDVISGTRYTIVIFWDYADAWYSEAQLQEWERLIFKERIHQYQLKQRWVHKEAHPLLDDPYVGLDDATKLPDGLMDSLTSADLKCNARRNQETAIKNGTVPEGIVVDQIITEEE